MSDAATYAVEQALSNYRLYRIGSMVWLLNKCFASPRGEPMSYVEPEEPFDREAVGVAMQGVEDAGRRCGLHLERSSVALPAEPDENGGPVLIVADFAVGGLAFSDRVLWPDVENTNKALRVMEADADLDDLAEFRRRLAEGKGPLDDLEAE